MTPWHDLVDEIRGGGLGYESIPADLIQAMIMQESNGNPDACRFEPAFYDTYIKNNTKVVAPTGVSLVTEQIGRATSWGLMQVMGQVARELGFKGMFFTELCDERLGVAFGVKKLAQCLTRYGNEDDGIAAYNAGSARRTTGGTLINQAYVDGVKAWRKRIIEEVVE